MYLTLQLDSNIKGRGKCLFKSAKEKSKDKDFFADFQMHSKLPQPFYVLYFGISLPHSSLHTDKLSEPIYKLLKYLNLFLLIFF